MDGSPLAKGRRPFLGLEDRVGVAYRTAYAPNGAHRHR
jgi:hypothetical protein